MSRARIEADLPEKFARLYDYNLDKFETPLDIWGIADIDAVAELAIRTYPEELTDLESIETDRHHLYWKRSWWKDYADNQENIDDSRTIWTFRNSAPQVAYVPIPIHHWIEASQIPPPPPSLEVMRKRNIAWQSAALLLKSADYLDKARNKYDQNKGRTRRVLTNIPGITPKQSRLSDKLPTYVDIVDDEYWLSELNGRLEWWRHIAQTRGSLLTEHGIVPTPRLSDIRELRNRLHKDNNAITPRLPDELAA